MGKGCRGIILVKLTAMLKINPGVGHQRNSYWNINSASNIQGVQLVNSGVNSACLVSRGFREVLPILFFPAGFVCNSSKLLVEIISSVKKQPPLSCWCVCAVDCPLTQHISPEPWEAAVPAGCCSALYPITQAHNTHPELIREDNLLWVKTLSEDSPLPWCLQGMKPLTIGDGCLHCIHDVKGRKGDPRSQSHPTALLCSFRVELSPLKIPI